MLRPKGAQKQVRLKCEIRLTFEVFFISIWKTELFPVTLERKTINIFIMTIETCRYIEKPIAVTDFPTSKKVTQ